MKKRLTQTDLHLATTLAGSFIVKGLEEARRHEGKQGIRLAGGSGEVKNGQSKKVLKAASADIGN